MAEIPKMFEIIDYLCRRNQISISKMCKAIGMRQSIITDLKMGRTKTLSVGNMQKIANYFHVSTDVFAEGVFDETQPNSADAEAIAGYHYLLNKEKAPANAEAKDEREISHLIEALESSDTLMYDGVPISDAAKESIRAAMRLGLEAAKIESKKKFTPKKYRDK